MTTLGLETQILTQTIARDGLAVPISLDAFNRLRVSAPQTIFDSKQTLNNQSLTFTTQVTGSGVVDAWSSARASTTLRVGAAAGTAVRQTRRRLNYQPAKSQLVFATFVCGTAAGVTKRVGQFDDANGVFLEVRGSALFFVIRSSVSGAPVDLPIAQAAWNIDQANGTEVLPPLDIGKAQILVIDYEWLGVGQVRFGFVLDGVIRWCHAQKNANVLTSVYMSTPNGPIRYEISSSGATAAGDFLETICCSVSSEGGADPTGFTTAVANTNAKTILTTFVPLIQIRLKTDGLGATVLPDSVQVYVSSASDDIEWGLFLNPVLAAGAAAVWNPASSASAVEFDVAATGTLSSSEQRLSAGFGRSQVTIAAPNANSLIALGVVLPSTRDILALCARSLTGTSNIRGALTWREL